MIAPLWRVVIAFRVLTFGLAVGGWGFARDEYPGTLAPVLLLVAMAGWTAVTSIAYGRGSGRRTRSAVVDLVGTVAVIAATLATQPTAGLHGSAPIITGIWVAGPAFALALTEGRDGGVGGALVVWVAVTALRARVGDAEFGNLVLLLVSSVLLGYAATTTRRATVALQQATAAAAAAEERERLSRSIHDGVLQVLAAVRRRGAEIGGEAADLAALAAEQEVALRALMSAGPTTAGGHTDLAATLRLLATPRVQVVTPAQPMPLPSHTVEELAAVVREALANTAAHAGDDARAWVTVEEDDARVLLGVRDDGRGIEPGRLDRAARDGHRGVSQSICGRVRDLGGSATLRSAPGTGTEWEIAVPVPAAVRR